MRICRRFAQWLDIATNYLILRARSASHMCIPAEAILATVNATFHFVLHPSPHVTNCPITAPPVIVHAMRA
jgi:hypothetical protein